MRANSGEFPQSGEEAPEAPAKLRGKKKQFKLPFSVFSTVNNRRRMYNEGKTRLVISFLPTLRQEGLLLSLPVFAGMMF
jgi:hypothetical protein